MLYYLPTTAPSLDKPAVRAALPHALSEAITPRHVTGGPDGRNGFVFADPNRVESARIGYYADRQTWRRIPGSEIWVGVETDNPPTPAGLARAEQLRGHLVTLADGRPWLIPIAREWRETDDGPRWHTALPQLSTMDDEGHWIPGQVEHRYQALCDVATRWHDAKFAAFDAMKADDDAEEIAITFDDLHSSAITVLAANYAVGPAEVCLLGVLSDASCVAILDSLIDVPGLMAAVKSAAMESSVEPAVSVPTPD